MVLILVLILAIFFGKKDVRLVKEIKSSKTHKTIILLLGYIIVTLPLVKWPGSVIHTGLENLLKAIVFYYFTIYFITDNRKFKLFIIIFVGCQTVRVVEPVYLHLTQGYWGSFASMGTGGWDLMDRLSGAPHDVVNPNGLAFIILTIIPFYYYLSQTSSIYRLVSIIVIPLSIYALMLTASRSGILGLCVIFLSVLYKSNNKLIIIILIFIGGLISLNFMNANQIDRYESIFSSNTKNAGTSEGRIEGIKKDFLVALRKPFFGHGLGTSREANANFGGEDKPSHNLYTEVAQELGFVGLFIFIALIKSIIFNFRKSMLIVENLSIKNEYLKSIGLSLQTWFYMNILFSFASYGLSSYEWYLFAGMSIALNNILIDMPEYNGQAI
ncbi:O-antigen ligase family protein [Oryzomonas rubra]|nr:O-antigen ligase family protein [Oryzomonas rubra]